MRVLSPPSNATGRSGAATRTVRHPSARARASARRSTAARTGGPLAVDRTSRTSRASRRRPVPRTHDHTTGQVEGDRAVLGVGPGQVR